ncbi:MAG: YlmC/YmxH family sporulation protein [Firmicutes bacterium]|jgi:sporulation protein, ylmc/ymxh family|nr:YlmC/YmxH family sporulation protein [Bacillota bacterium]
MELSFSELRTKEVVNTNDGRRLGKVCDIVFCYPENRVIGIVVPGCKGFAFWKSEQFIDMKNIVKIGDDVVLVNFNMPPKPCGRKPGHGGCGGNNCNPPPPPPGGPGMGGPGPSYPPSGGYPSQPQYPGRRSYEEYE